MRTESITSYQYHELDSSAQAKARDYLAVTMEYAWFTESIDSIKCFCDEFGAKIKDARIDPAKPRVSYVETDADSSNFRGYTLKQAKALNESRGNGFFVYFECVNTFYVEFKRAKDAKGAFFAAIEAAVSAINSDIEYQYSKEGIEGMIDANGYEFTKNGYLR